MDIENFYNSIQKAPLQRIEDEITKSFGVNLYIKRLDLLHPTLNGNKFYKLKYNLLEAKRLGINRLLTFGGAFSNHIYATAAAGKLFGFETNGIIRGDELNKKSSKTLEFAAKCGMKLLFVSRNDYRNKEMIFSKFNDCLGIPEGGSNEFALKGMEELTDEIIDEMGIQTTIVTAVGTGGTIGGIISNQKLLKKPIGIPVLKNAEFINKEISILKFRYKKGKELPKIEKWIQHFNFHYGGYGKVNHELVNFILWFEDRHQIPLEQVYTGKMLCGLYTLIRQNWFNEGETIVALHTGGLQGKNFALFK